MWLPPPYGITYAMTAVAGTGFTETAGNNSAVLADTLPALPAIVQNADLLNTDMSLAEIALEAGFFDQSHFSRNFKRFEKLTPVRFRLKYKV